MHLCCLCTQTPLAFQCRDGRALSDETADASPIWRIRSDALSASISPLSISCKIRDHREHDGGQEPGGHTLRSVNVAHCAAATREKSPKGHDVPEVREQVQTGQN